MKKRTICNQLVLILTILLVLLPTTIYSQHRIPNKGENIQFCPVTEEQRMIHAGYDCFYAEDLVYKKGKIRFKNNYRFKKGKNKLTPLVEIENYTFHVRDIKTVRIMNKLVMLIYLTRNEDGENVVLRLQLEGRRDNDMLSNSMFEYKKGYNNFGNIDNGLVVDRINLPYINSDSLKVFKERYRQKNIVVNHTTIRNLGGNAIGNEAGKDLDNLVEIVNNRKINFNQGDLCFCIGIDFVKTTNESSNKIPCAKLRTSQGRIIDIPLCYFNKESKKDIYLFSKFFITEEVYNEMRLTNFALKSLIKKYVGKDVYYGLDNTFTSDQLEKCIILGTNSKFDLKKGKYRCLDFVVNKEVIKRTKSSYTTDYPYVILQESLGETKFKVGIRAEDYSGKGNCFEKYFTHAYLAEEIIAERERKEIKKQQELENEFGKEYGSYLSWHSDEYIKRFRKLKRKYGPYIAKKILNREYEIGWSEDLVIESLGYPDDKNRSVGPWGVHEQWIYRSKYSYDATYLYFENGKLKSFQE